MIIIGTYEPTSSRQLKTILYNTQNDSIQTYPGLDQHRELFVSLVYKDNIYITGGINTISGKSIPTVESFDCTNKSRMFVTTYRKIILLIL